jgi:hypothetical protein
MLPKHRVLDVLPQARLILSRALERPLGKRDPSNLEHSPLNLLHSRLA